MGFDFAKIKASFLSREEVAVLVEKAGRKGCERHAAFVRRTAKSSIKPAPKIDVATGQVTRKRKGLTLKDATSTPPNPPYSHRGDLKRMIFFTWDAQTSSVVCGPVIFESAKEPGVAPGLLEHGGSKVRTKLVSAKGNGLGRAATDRQRESFFRLAKEGRITNFARKRIQVKAVYRGNPFMGPADQKERAKMAERFKGTFGL